MLPSTATGCSALLAVPLPSWPASLPPQQYAVLSAATAQVCRAPALTEMKRKPPDTASGVRLHGSLLVEVTHVSVGGLPSCPYGPHPQQYAAESAVPRPHVNEPPVATRNSDRAPATPTRSEEHTSELQSQSNLVCRLLLEKKKKH